jgi:hypothetical protein
LVFETLQMEFNVEAITGSDVSFRWSLPYPTAMVSSVVLPNTTSQSTDVLTSVTSSTGQHTQHVGDIYILCDVTQVFRSRDYL